MAFSAGIIDADGEQPSPFDAGTWPLHVGTAVPPATSPLTGPYWCVPVPDAWLVHVFGCMGAIMQPEAWKTASESATLDVLAWVDTLLGIMAGAQLCPEYGMVSVTISAGSATGTTAVSFPSAFAAAPIVLVSGDSGTVICSAESITDSGFTARITANVVLGASHTETVYWQAAPAS